MWRLLRNAITLTAIVDIWRLTARREKRFWAHSPPANCNYEAASRDFFNWALWPTYLYTFNCQRLIFIVTAVTERLKVEGAGGRPGGRTIQKATQMSCSSVSGELSPPPPPPPPPNNSCCCQLLQQQHSGQSSCAETLIFSKSTGNNIKWLGIRVNNRMKEVQKRAIVRVISNNSSSLFEYSRRLGKKRNNAMRKLFMKRKKKKIVARIIAFKCENRQIL